MDYDTYEDLQGLWADLEAALALVLTHPAQVGNFEAKVLQLDAWLQELLAHDRDAGLYLMYQLASSSHTGYSAAHALVCATLSHILAGTYHLPPQERDALVRAALTMNIGMTQLQDQLALQRERPSAAQQEAIRMHPVEGRRLLERMQITNGLWLDVVTLHHINIPPQLPLLQQQAAERLARLLATVDHYAAMISPRRSRAGRSVAGCARLPGIPIVSSPCRATTTTTRTITTTITRLRHGASGWSPGHSPHWRWGLAS